MYRKPRSEAYIEPMPKNQFLTLMREFKKMGGKYLANEQSENFLNIQGVEASTLNATTILFRRRPSRSAVYEELFHAQQYRDGKITGSAENAYKCEIEAQLYLLKHAEEFQLTEPEITQTHKALKWYENKLRTMKGDVNHDYL